ncbi:MAG: 3-keto-disaccharide hydrolase [Thermoguttaceae bacterium]
MTSLLNLVLTLAAFSATDAAAFPKNELGVKPPKLVANVKLTPDEVAAGKLALLDGVSLFGWTVENGNVKVEGDRVVAGDVGAKLTRHLPHGFKLTHSGGSVAMAVGRRPRGETANGGTGNSGNFTQNLNGVYESIAYEWGNEKLTVTLDTKSVGTNFLAMAIEPLESKPLFDGKNLDGWKVLGDVKASVEDGCLRLQGGSGSLEHENSAANFLLQLEFKTERPVNSGVFFRCVPQSKMDGYECQIFNSPPDGDYQKFLGTATGGLFRRQVGREIGVRDGDWVALAILADGNNFSTWVNGVQVTSWTDDRTADPNPRRGCRTEAGTIQLQGHDPTTEVLFRNIRITNL